MRQSRRAIAITLIVLMVIVSGWVASRALTRFSQRLAETRQAATAAATAENYEATAIEEQEDPSRVFSLGPGGGGAFDVFAFSPDYVFVGTDLGGLFRSHDHGQTWETANRGLYDYMINDLAVDPVNPMVIYAATPGGVYKSADSANSWSLLKNGFPAKDSDRYSAKIGTVAVDPVNPKVIYAGTADIRADQLATGNGKLYKSTDGGANWTDWNVGDSSAAFYKIVVDPLNDSHVLAATSTGFFQSEDGGQNWTKTDDLQSRGLAAGIDRPNARLVLYRTEWTNGVFKSEDGGLTWNRLRGFQCATACHFYRIALDPSDAGARKVYVGDYGDWHEDQGIFATSNGGLNWHQINTVEDPGWVGLTRVGRVRSLGVNPYSPGEIYYGNSMGLFRTSDEGHWIQIYTTGTTVFGGKSAEWPSQWRGRGKIDNTQANTKPMFNPLKHSEYYVGFSDTYIWKTVNNGATWENITLPGNNDIRALAANPGDAKLLTLYASSAAQQCCAGALYWTVDGGKKWTQAQGLPNDRIFDVAVPAYNTDLVYAATLSHGLFVSLDRGRTFTARNGAGGDSLPDGNGYRIAIDTQHPGKIYVAVGGGDGGIFESQDGGSTWQKRSNSTNCSAVAISPSNSQQLFAACGLQLYTSRDSGIAWTLLLDARDRRLLPSNQIISGYIRDIALHPKDPNVLCAVIKDDPYHDQASGGGLHCSMDGGTTWKELAGPLGLLYRATAVAFHPLPDPMTGEHDLFYMTGGNGAYRIPFGLFVKVYKETSAE